MIMSVSDLSNLVDPCYPSGHSLLSFCLWSRSVFISTYKTI